MNVMVFILLMEISASEYIQLVIMFADDVGMKKIWSTEVDISINSGPKDNG